MNTLMEANGLKVEPQPNKRNVGNFDEEIGLDGKNKLPPEKRKNRWLFHKDEEAIPEEERYLLPEEKNRNVLSELDLDLQGMFRQTQDMQRKE